MNEGIFAPINAVAGFGHNHIFDPENVCNLLTAEHDSEAVLNSESAFVSVSHKRDYVLFIKFHSTLL